MRTILVPLAKIDDELRETNSVLADSLRDGWTVVGINVLRNEAAAPGHQNRLIIFLAPPTREAEDAAALAAATQELTRLVSVLLFFVVVLTFVVAVGASALWSW